MIKELRIGNLIEFDERIGFVQSIDPQRLFVRFPKTNIYFSDEMNEATEFYVRSEDLLPVDLTHDIMINLGFYQNTNPDLEESLYYSNLWTNARLAIYIDKSRSSGNITIIESTEIGKQFSLCSMPVQYVHQLQNLFFSLAGIELNLSKL